MASQFGFSFLLYCFLCVVIDVVLLKVYISCCTVSLFFQWCREHGRQHLSRGFECSQRNATSGTVWRKPRPSVTSHFTLCYALFTVFILCHPFLYCAGKCDPHESQVNIAVCFVFRLYVRNFWSQKKRLPTATLDRMLTVLRSLYSCQIERCFLSLVTNLLLEMTSQSPDFQRNMFEYPLSECTFQVGSIYSSPPLWVSLNDQNDELGVLIMCFHSFYCFKDYVIDSNWRFRSTVMTPMFVATQSTQSTQSVAASQAIAMKGKLRATQTTLEFSQTQTAGATLITYPNIRTNLLRTPQEMSVHTPFFLYLV